MIKKITYGSFQESSTVGVMGFTVSFLPEIEYSLESFTKALQEIINFPLSSNAPKVVRLQGIFKQEEVLPLISGMLTLKEKGFKLEVLAWDEEYFPFFNYADRLVLFHDVHKPHSTMPCDELVLVVEEKLPKEYPMDLGDFKHTSKQPRILAAMFKNIPPQDMLLFLRAYDGNIRLYPFSPHVELQIWPSKEEKEKNGN